MLSSSFQPSCASARKLVSVRSRIVSTLDRLSGLNVYRLNVALVAAECTPVSIEGGFEERRVDGKLETSERSIVGKVASRARIKGNFATGDESYLAL